MCGLEATTDRPRLLGSIPFEGDKFPRMPNHKTTSSWLASHPLLPPMATADVPRRAIDSPPAMLTGTELLAKVKDLGEASKTELVRATGYVSTKEDGSERLNFTAFYEALLEARGIHLGPARGDGAPGRKLSYVTHVLFNGNLLIGKAYTAQLGLQPGDPFQIQLGRRQIRLHPLDAPPEGEEGTSSNPGEQQGS